MPTPARARRAGRTWTRLSIQLRPEMVTRLRTRAVQEEAEIREVVHRALLAYLATPLSTLEPR